MTTNNQNNTLSEYSDEKRLKIFQLLTSACSHLYSKGKLQKDKFNTIAPIFADITENDPNFMAALCAWAAKQDNKDLKVLTVFFNALNDASGEPFFPGSTLNKPNYRQVSAAVLQTLDPHLAGRVLEFCHLKFGVSELLNDARHFPTALVTAFRKYLKYREQNPEMLTGAKRAGLGNKLKNIYRLTHTGPSDEAAAILGWKQKDGRVIEAKKLPTFDNLTSDEIAEQLQTLKLSPTVALSVLPPDKVTAKVAKTLLENSTGNQAIILYNWFARNGHLENAEIKNLFKDKIKQSTTAVDRIDTLTKNATAEDKQEMAEVRAQKRKKQADTSKLGKIFVHIDISGSMQAAIEFAKEKACILAECVDNPQENFRWGLFGTYPKILDLPKTFTKEGFYQALYGVRTSGSTDCIACYHAAREFGADVDVYITDGGHNIGAIQKRINDCHENNPKFVKPRAALIINFGPPNGDTLVAELPKVGIPVALMQPNALSESALVAQSVRTALIGELAIIEEIMNTPLPNLPKWWNSIGVTKPVAVEAHQSVTVSNRAQTSKTKRRVKA